MQAPRKKDQPEGYPGRLQQQKRTRQPKAKLGKYLPAPVIWARDDSAATFDKDARVGGIGAPPKSVQKRKKAVHKK